MPELPDVEGFRREAAEHVTDQRVHAVDVHDPQVVRLERASRLPGLLDGRYISIPRRRGKWLILPTARSRGAAEEPPTLLLHFGMTGTLRWCPLDTEPGRYDRIILRFSGGELRYSDMRKLKGLYVANQQSDMDDLLGELGPDADAVTAKQFRSLLTRTRRQLKAALMDQSVISGLGNLCVDEILWRSRIHPKRVPTDLPASYWNELHRNMRSMLRQSSRQGHVPSWPSWLTGHRDDPEGECPRCHTPFRHGNVASRSTVWCPNCQRIES